MEALFYKAEGEGIRCKLCPHECFIREQSTGICRQRRNIEGELVPEGYGRIAAFGIDPIEKKPLYHFYPGTEILSVGGLWCNLRCSFCQNWNIAHQEQKTVEVSSEQLIKIAVQEGSIGIAFTYNEPTIWYEYVLDTAKLARDEGLKIVLVTNGFIQLEPLEALLPYIDAMNIDVKAFNEEYYKKICGGRLEDVKKVVQRAAKACHIEITTLIVGELNDDIEENISLFRWLGNINKDIPLHLSRYFPNYKMEHPPTPVETLNKLSCEARKYLDYVYIGNLAGADRDIYCPDCGNKLVVREPKVKTSGIKDGKCIKCGRIADIIMP